MHPSVGGGWRGGREWGGSVYVMKAQNSFSPSQACDDLAFDLGLGKWFARTNKWEPCTAVIRGWLHRCPVSCPLGHLHISTKEDSGAGMKRPGNKPDPSSHPSQQFPCNPSSHTEWEMICLALVIKNFTAKLPEAKGLASHCKQLLVVYTPFKNESVSVV